MGLQSNTLDTIVGVETARAFVIGLGRNRTDDLLELLVVSRILKRESI